MSADVAVYVQGRYAKPAYKVESYNVRAWPGLELVVDALRRAGVEVDYCSAATVGRYKVVLVSVTASCDWYSFVAERVRWGDHGAVIAGGAGVMNVRPFLRWVDMFCLGRAEKYIVSLVQAAIAGEKHDHPSVVYSADFDIQGTYAIDGGTDLYPHPVTLANGKVWTEAAVGCQRRCLFCAYTWHRRHIGGLQNAAGAGDVLWGGSSEKTIFELDLDDPASWGNTLRIVGLDGFSERLRRMVNKPITRDMWRAFVRGFASPVRPGGQLRVYNLVGLPTETEDDWLEFAEDLAAADADLPQADKQRGLDLHCTPFRAMPATPCACWPMSPRNYRGQIARVLRGRKPYDGFLFFRGGSIYSVESHGTESLPTVVLDVLALRGVEDDSEIIARLATSPKFRSASMNHRIAILQRHVDIDRLFGAYTWENLPTRYLRTYTDLPKLKRTDTVARKRAGRPWPEAVPV